MDHIVLGGNTGRVVKKSVTFTTPIKRKIESVKIVAANGTLCPPHSTNLTTDMGKMRITYAIG